MRADDNEQERIVEDAGEGQDAWKRSSGRLEATEQLLRDSEGSSAYLYGLRGAVLGNAQSSQPGTNAESLPTVGVVDKTRESSTQDTVISMRRRAMAASAAKVTLEASLGNLAAPETSVPGLGGGEGQGNGR